MSQFCTHAKCINESDYLCVRDFRRCFHRFLTMAIFLLFFLEGECGETQATHWKRNLIWIALIFRYNFDNRVIARSAPPNYVEVVSLLLIRLSRILDGLATMPFSSVFSFCMHWCFFLKKTCTSSTFEWPLFVSGKTKFFRSSWYLPTPNFFVVVSIHLHFLCYCSFIYSNANWDCSRNVVQLR